MSRSYIFKMPDGSVEMMTIEEAKQLNSIDVELRIREIYQNSKNKRMIKDGFEPGVQDNINEYCGSYGEYARRIKELGLVEIGYEAVPKDTTVTTDVSASLEFALSCREEGIDLTDCEVEALASGEMLKDVVLE